ncbi:MAG: O-antigen ligase family protein [Chloroflexota bacterium]|nr:O-antigen ligase family protein [Chloroflexota bacterium]
MIRRNLAPAAVTGGAATGIGALAAVSPLGAALAALGAGVVFAVFALRERMVSVFLVSLAVGLAGYAFSGRTFAHLGIPPLYVGELLLALALLSLIFTWRRAPLTWIDGLLAAFMLLGLVRTVPYIQRDGVDAFRDATLWGYGIFAFAASRAVRAEDFAKISGLYRWAMFPFMLWVPVLAIAAPIFGPQLPKVPDGTLLLTFKGGDAGVHLAGALAFALIGLAGAAAVRQTLFLPAWLIALIASGAANRGGLIAANVAWAAVAFVRPRKTWLYGLPAVAILLAALIASDPSVYVGGRPMSLGQVQDNVISILNDSNDSKQGSKEFRLRWWGDIIDYTVFGPYFWTGKGFGVNLADDDGYQVEADGSLRAPHNSHFTVLARMGVPGLVLWLTLIVGFIASLIVAQHRARRSGAVFWAGIQLWVALYAAAALVDTAFDPYLEGPQGSLWFWTLFGIGVAALRFGKQAAAERSPANPAVARPVVAHRPPAEQEAA